jgi:hypothetical protein
MYGTADMLEANELELWRPPPVLMSDLASSNARRCVRHWKEWMKITNKYYEPFADFVFPIFNQNKQLSNQSKRVPYRDETLIEFLNRAAESIEKNGWGRPLEERSFRSFLGYVRKIPEEAAFVEHIFNHSESCTRKISSSRRICMSNAYQYYPSM